jgi:hypothetical protein
MKFSIHVDQTVTANGNSSIHIVPIGKQLILFVNVTDSPTGTSPTITFTVDELDPGDTNTVISTVSGTTLSAFGTQEIPIRIVRSGAVRVSWVVGGESPSFTGVYTTLVALDAVSASPLYGTSDSEDVRPVSITNEGHIEVAVHGPRQPLGSIHTESLSPVFQTDAVYGINSDEVRVTASGSGDATAANQLFTISTGTTIGSYAVLQSRKRLRYRPGQGMVGRFSALWSSPVASSIVVAGFGTPEAGYYFGYNGTSFGILHSTGGMREIRTLTVTGASSTTETIVIKLDGTSHNVAVTNNGSTTKTAWEIAQATYAGWTAEAIGATVVFVSNTTGARSGTYEINTATAPTAGTFAQTKAGVSNTSTWIPQSSWNADKMDGTGRSGATLDPSKGNLFQINVECHGFGSVSFKIEITPTDGNNADFVTVHTILIPNTRTTTAISQPSFPFSMAANSAGSTTNVSMSCAFFSGFIEGTRVNSGGRFSYAAQSTAVDSSAYRALATIRNDLVFTGRPNQSVFYLKSVTSGCKHTSPVMVYLIKNATLAGTPNFSQWSTASSTYVDTSATTCTVDNNSQIIWSGVLGAAGELSAEFDEFISIQPGETITIAAKTTTGTADYVCMALNTREDQ